MKSNEKIIGIIAAMDSELSLLLNELEERKEETIYGLVFYSGKLEEKSVVLVKAGIGKVNASRCTQILIDHYNPRYIINTGIAGGVAPSLKVGDVVVANGLLQHDFDVTAFGHAKGYLCTGENDKEPTVFKSDEFLLNAIFKSAETVVGRNNVHIGLIATGDQFISSLEKKKELRNEFGVSAAEMEGGAIAQTASMSGVPFAVIRAISDLADGTASSSYTEFEEKAASFSALTLKKALLLL